MAGIRLALAALAGMIVTAGAAEVAARLIWPEQIVDSCALADGYRGGFRANCTSKPMRLPESPWIRDTTNECGYRSAQSCRPRPPGTVRIAMLGTSVARGHFVAYADTFAARAAADLSKQCHRAVEIQNLAIPRTTYEGQAAWHLMADRTAEALALHPDSLLVVMSPTDLGFYSGARLGRALAGDLTPDAAGKAAAKPGLVAQLKGVRQALTDNSRALGMARPMVYRDPQRYVPLFLRHGDDIDYLRTPLSKPWLDRVALADQVLARIGAAASAAGVPWTVVISPTYGQAVMAAGAPTPGIDPLLIGHTLAPLVAAHGGRLVDLTALMARQPDLGGHYYVGDGHPNAIGHAVIAAGVTSALRHDVPALSGCTAA